MKFVENVVTVEGNAVFEKNKKASLDETSISHIIRSLTDMYSNPMLAISREYLSNGYDATIERMGVDSSFGTMLDTPVEVSLPSSLNPSFIVRDYGTGMDRDVLSNVFLTYGASTKRDTNSQVGGFGLGAKSALAAVSSFTVISVKDGKKNTGIIQKDADGVPEISFLPEVETDEPSGTIVTIDLPNHQELSRIFNSSKLLLGFPQGSVKLNGVLHDYSVHNTEHFTKLGEHGWMLNSLLDWTAENKSVADHELVVVVGPISYSVKREQLMPGEEYTEHQKVFSPMLNNCVVNLPIGSVDFTPARENLIFSDRTRKAIISRAVALNEAATNRARQAIMDAPTKRDAVRLAHRLSRYILDGQYNAEKLFYKDEVIPNFHSDYFSKEDKNAWLGRGNERFINNLNSFPYIYSDIRLIVVTDVKDYEEAKALNLYRKAFQAKHKDGIYAKQGVSPVVLFSESGADTFGYWADAIAEEIFTAKNWETQGVEYRKIVEAEKRAARPARQRHTVTPGDMSVTVVSTDRSYRGTRPTTYPTTANSLKDDVVIYMQATESNTGTLSSKFARASRADIKELSLYNLLDGIATLRNYFATESTNNRTYYNNTKMKVAPTLVRLPSRAKVGNFLKALPNAMSIDEAFNRMKEELRKEGKFMELLVFGQQAKFEWVKDFSDMSQVENEEVREYLKAIRHIAITHPSMSRSHTAQLIQNESFKSVFAGLWEEVVASHRYPLPLLESVRNSRGAGTEAVVEYINLKYPAPAGELAA